MEQKYIIGILIAIIITSLIAISFIFIPRAGLSPSSSDLVACNTLSFSSENAINILFYADKETAEEYKSQFFKISPLKENEDKFNFYYIDSYRPDCELYKGIAILCYSKSLIKTSGSCPSDYIVVVNDEHEKSIRSSSYMNILSLNKKHDSTVFHHEFGHSFVSLAEEYVPAKIPLASQNCVSSCDEFNGLNDGCFESCSDSSHYRSIDKGIMRTLKSDSYGTFNSMLISEKIKSLTGSTNYLGITSKTISLEGSCSDNSYALLTISPEFTVLNKEIIKGCITGTGSGGLQYQVLDSQGNPLSDSEFNLNIFTDVELETDFGISGDIYEYESDFYLPIPLTENTDKIIISDNQGEVLLSTSLSNLNNYPCRK